MTTYLVEYDPKRPKVWPKATLVWALSAQEASEVVARWREVHHVISVTILPNEEAV